MGAGASVSSTPSSTPRSARPRGLSGFVSRALGRSNSTRSYDSDSEGYTTSRSGGSTSRVKQDNAKVKELESKLLNAKLEHKTTKKDLKLARERIAELEDKSAQMFAALKMMKQQNITMTQELDEAEAHLTALGEPERDVHLERFAKEQIQSEFEKYQADAEAEKLQAKEDMRRLKGNLSTRAVADEAAKAALREQMHGLRDAVASLRKENTELQAEKASLEQKIATMDARRGVTEEEAGEFDSPFGRQSTRRTGQSGEQTGRTRRSSRRHTARSSVGLGDGTQRSMMGESSSARTGISKEIGEQEDILLMQPPVIPQDQSATDTQHSIPVQQATAGDDSSGIGNADSLLESSLGFSDGAHRPDGVGKLSLSAMASPVAAPQQSKLGTGTHGGKPGFSSQQAVATAAVDTSASLLATAVSSTKPSDSPATKDAKPYSTVTALVQGSKSAGGSGTMRTGRSTARSSMASTQRLPAPETLDDAIARLKEILPTGVAAGGEHVIEDTGSEMDLQWTFAGRMRKRFGAPLRAELVNHLVQMLSSGMTGVTTILGPGGSGKTYISVSIATALRDMGISVIPLFVGVSQWLLQPRRMSQYVCQHIFQIAGVRKPVPNVLSEIVTECTNAARMIPSGRLVIIVDGVDLVFDSAKPSMVEWMSRAFDHLAVLFTVRQEKTISVIARQVDIAAEVELEGLTLEQRVKMIQILVDERRLWLLSMLEAQHAQRKQDALTVWKKEQDARERRRLQRERLRGASKRQTEKPMPDELKDFLASHVKEEEVPESLDDLLQAYELEAFLEKEGCQDADYVSLAVTHLGTPHRSNTMLEAVTELPKRSDLVGAQMLAALESRHGSTVTYCAMTLLETSRNGLTEAELLAAMLLPERSPDPALPGRLGPSAGFITGAQWRNFLADIQWLVRRVEKSKIKGYDERWEWDGQGSVPIVLKDAAVVEAVKVRYRLHECFWHRKSSSNQANRRLAVYFRTLLNFDPPSKDDYAPAVYKEKMWQYKHAFRDVIYHLIQGFEWRAVEIALTDLLFVRNKAAALGPYDLLEDYTDALEQGANAAAEDVNNGLSFLQRSRLQDFARFVGMYAVLFDRYPQLLLQQAANEPDQSSVARAALKLVDSQMSEEAWFKYLNKAQLGDPCVMTISHTGSAMAVTFSPDGRKVVTGCSDGFGGRLTVWDARAGAELASISMTGHVKLAMFNADGSALLGFSHDGLVTIVDTNNFKERARDNLLGVDSTCATLSIDGKKLVIGTKTGDIVVYDIIGADLTKMFSVVDYDNQDRVTTVGSLALHPTMKCVAAGLGNGDIRLYYLDMYEGFTRRGTLANVHTSRLNSVVFSTDGSQILAGGVDRKMTLWSVPEEALEAAQGGVLEPDEAGREDEYDFDDVSPQMELEQDSEILSCSLSADGSSAVSGLENGCVTVFNTETHDCILKLGPHSAGVNGVAFAPNGNYIVSTSSDCSMKMWSVGGQEVQDSFSGHENARIVGLSYSKEGSEVASAANDGSLRLWSAKRGVEMARFEGHKDEISGVGFSPIAQEIMTMSGIDGTVRWWSALSGSEMRDRRESSIFVTCFDIDKAGVRVAGGGFDGSLAVWNPLTGEHLLRLGIEVEESEEGLQLERVTGTHDDAVSDCKWSPNDDRIASASHDSTIKIWNTTWANCVATLKGHNGPVNKVAWHEKSRLLASAGMDFTFRLWNVDSQRCCLECKEHGGAVNDVKWSNGSRFLFTAADDRSVRAWTVSHDPSKDECTVQPIALFAANDPMLSVAVSPVTVEDEITCGDSKGKIFMLQLLLPGEW